MTLPFAIPTLHTARLTPRPATMNDQPILTFRIRNFQVPT